MTNDLFRDLLEGRIPMPVKPKQPTFAQAMQNVADEVGEIFRNIFEAFQPLIESLQDLGVIETPPPADPRARALWAKQHQGNGPQRDVLRNRGRVNRYQEKG